MDTNDGRPGGLSSCGSSPAVSPVPASIPDAARTQIEQEDIAWVMEWGERYPDKPAEELIFEESGALAILLLNEVIFLNTNWWKKEWPEEARNTLALCVNCNDVFAWACADAETATFDDLRSIYEHWSKDSTWGAEVWCIKKRGMMPQWPVYRNIKAAGIWDLDAMDLRPNGTWPAQGIETRSAETERLSPKGESPVACDAPTPNPDTGN